MYKAIRMKNNYEKKPVPLSGKYMEVNWRTAIKWDAVSKSTTVIEGLVNILARIEKILRISENWYSSRWSDVDCWVSKVWNCGTKISLDVIRKPGMRGESEEKKSIASAKRVDKCILGKLQKKWDWNVAWETDNKERR